MTSRCSAGLPWLLRELGIPVNSGSRATDRVSAYRSHHRQVVCDAVPVRGHHDVRRLHRPSRGEEGAVDDEDDMAGHAAERAQLLGEAGSGQPLPSVTLSTITSMAAMRSTTPQPPSGPSSGSITGVRPVTASGSTTWPASPPRPASVHVSRAHHAVARADREPLGDAAVRLGLLAARLRCPRAAGSACSWRNGVDPTPDRYPRRATRRGTGRSRT